MQWSSEPYWTGLGEHLSLRSKCASAMARNLIRGANLQNLMLYQGTQSWSILVRWEGIVISCSFWLKLPMTYQERVTKVSLLSRKSRTRLGVAKTSFMHLGVLYTYYRWGAPKSQAGKPWRSSSTKSAIK